MFRDPQLDFVPRQHVHSEQSDSRMLGADLPHEFLDFRVRGCGGRDDQLCERGLEFLCLLDLRLDFGPRQLRKFRALPGLHLTLNAMVAVIARMQIRRAS
jgi:hypothetical protein